MNWCLTIFLVEKPLVKFDFTVMACVELAVLVQATKTEKTNALTTKKIDLKDAKKAFFCSRLWGLVHCCDVFFLKQMVQKWWLLEHGFQRLFKSQKRWSTLIHSNLDLSQGFLNGQALTAATEYFEEMGNVSSGRHPSCHLAENRKNQPKLVYFMTGWKAWFGFAKLLNVGSYLDIDNVISVRSYILCLGDFVGEELKAQCMKPVLTREEKMAQRKQDRRPLWGSKTLHFGLHFATNLNKLELRSENFQHF